MSKILLVEDDKSLREIYGVRLGAEGYEIVSAGDGEEALAMAVKERPDLIISDVMMPKISGFDMLDILRATPETKDIKVIMMTALSSDDQRKRGEALGANRYLVKSQVGIEDIVRTVHEVLNDTPQVSTSPSTQQSASSPLPQATPVERADSSIPLSQNPTVGSMSSVPTQNWSGLPQPVAPFSTPAPESLISQPIQTTEPTPSAPTNSTNTPSGNATELNITEPIPVSNPQPTQTPVQAQPAPQPAPVEYHYAPPIDFNHMPPEMPAQPTVTEPAIGSIPVYDEVTSAPAATPIQSYPLPQQQPQAQPAQTPAAPQQPNSPATTNDGTLGDGTPNFFNN